MDHVCARCPKLLGASCCEPKPGERLATLTTEDVRRIREHLRRRAETFSEVEVLSDEEARAYEAQRPSYAGYFRSGPNRVTLRRRGGGSGACVFHDRERGCVLPSEVRPTACRLYPFERYADGSIGLQVGRYGSIDAAARGSDACLAVEESEDFDEVLRAFSLTREEVEALDERLRREVRSG